jgi:hypothetical protein
MEPALAEKSESRGKEISQANISHGISKGFPALLFLPGIESPDQVESAELGASMPSSQTYWLN